MFAIAFFLMISPLYFPLVTFLVADSLKSICDGHKINIVSSTVAWKVPWMEEPGRLRSMGSLRVGHD